MKYLTTAQVLFIHDRLARETGGSRGLRDLGAFESAVSRPRMTLGGEDLYPDIFHKAAALMESLVLNHPFVDGNKRVGITAPGLLLRSNGRQLTASNAEVVSFTLSVARREKGLEEIAGWLARKSRPLDPGASDAMMVYERGRAKYREALRVVVRE